MVETKLYCLEIHIPVIKQKDVTSRKDRIVTIWGLEGEGGLCLEWGLWKDFQRQHRWQGTIAQPGLGDYKLCTLCHSVMSDSLRPHGL